MDWWSFGILIHDMLTGAPPFTGTNRKTITERVLKGKLQLKNYLTPNAKDILKKLLNRTVDKRLGAGDRDALSVREHRFFSGVKWNEVLERKMAPPFMPLLKSEDDVSNFDEEFTSRPAIDSPPGWKNIEYLLPQFMFPHLLYFCFHTNMQYCFLVRCDPESNC